MGGLLLLYPHEMDIIFTSEDSVLTCVRPSPRKSCQGDETYTLHKESCFLIVPWKVEGVTCGDYTIHW